MHARAVAVFLVACALTAMFGVSLAPSAGAAAPRSAQVTPAGALGDQVVHVMWQHFRPTHADGTFNVTIMQCSAHPTSVLRDCNTADTYPLSLTGNQAQGVTQKDGTGSAFIDIETTARLPALACTETHPCSLLLFENTIDGFDPDKLPADRTLVPLWFRKSSGDCPPVTHFDLRLESESSAAAAFYQWSADVCTGRGAFTVDVTNTSSNAARQQFFAGNVDIGVSSLPPQPPELPPDPRAYAVTPVDLTAIVLAYNIVDPVTGQQITDVTLTPRLVARLLSDTDVITFFDDPEFKKLNPHHHFPASTSEPGLRAEQNADTWIVTNWLASDPAARSFLNGHDRYGIRVNPAWRGVNYPTDVFEARNPTGAYLPRTGEEGVALKLFHASKPAEGVSSSPTDIGFLGVLDLPTARRFDLPAAKLTAAVGKPSVGATAASIQAGYRAMTVTAKGFHVEPGSPTDPEAYPLTKVDHALTPMVVDNSLTRARIRYLLAYARGPGQETLPPGFIQFPKPKPKPTPPPTTTTTSTTTTTTTTTTTIAPSAPVETGISQTPYVASPSFGPPNPGPVVTGARRPSREKAVAPRALTPRLALVGQQDGLALPIVLALGTLALVYCIVDYLRRRRSALLAATRHMPATLRRRRGRIEATS